MSKTRKKQEKAPTPPMRLHFSFTDGALADLTAIEKQISGSQARGRSWLVRAALRCFRRSLETGVAAESGELLEHKQAGPKRRR